MARCFTSLQEPESGCCGMAGTFGVRKKTRAIGQRLFARKLKPAIEAADNETIVVANGFSCHEQIVDGTGESGRRVLHPVEVIEMCLR